MTVLIDGVRYVPADMQPQDAAMRLLNQVYGRLWAEAHYDALNVSTQAFAEPLAALMSEANKLMGFKK